MAKKIRRKFTDEQKRKAVDDYVSGRKTAEQVAAENRVERELVYKWRVQLSEKAKGVRVAELEEQGVSRAHALEFEKQRAELEAYKATVAQQAVIIDLLKKLQTSTDYLPTNELNGLIEIQKRLARAKRQPKP